MARLIASVRPSGKPMSFRGRGRRTSGMSGNSIRQKLGVLADGRTIPAIVRRKSGGQLADSSLCGGEQERVRTNSHHPFTHP